MLQDLDQLAARIGLLVQRTRQLHAERDTLRTRLSDSETRQSALQKRCADNEAELAQLRALLADHDKAASSARADADQAVVVLREQLEREAAERKALETRLTVHDTDLTRLRAAAAAARERIDAVLSRLPGASSMEEQP
jgi:chromosome segregation ATPase